MITILYEIYGLSEPVKKETCIPLFAVASQILLDFKIAECCLWVVPRACEVAADTTALLPFSFTELFESLSRNFFALSSMFESFSPLRYHQV